MLGVDPGLATRTKPIRGHTFWSIQPYGALEAWTGPWVNKTWQSKPRENLLLFPKKHSSHWALGKAKLGACTSAHHSTTFAIHTGAVMDRLLPKTRSCESWKVQVLQTIHHFFRARNIHSMLPECLMAF